MTRIADLNITGFSEIYLQAPKCLSGMASKKLSRIVTSPKEAPRLDSHGTVNRRAFCPAKFVDERIS